LKSALLLSLICFSGYLLAQQKMASDFPKTLYDKEELEAMGKKAKKILDTVPKYDSLQFLLNKKQSYYLYLNPSQNSAYTGISGKFNVMYGFSGLYPESVKTFSQNHYVNMDFSFGKKQNHCLGFSFLRAEVGGIFNESSFNLAYCGRIKLIRSHTLRLGINYGYEQRKIDFSKLSFGDMIDPKYGYIYESQEQRFGPSRGYHNNNVGLMYTNKFMEFSFGIQNVIQPRSGFIATGKKPMLLTFNLTGFLPIKKVLITPVFSLLVENANENSLPNKGFGVVGANVFYGRFFYSGLSISTTQILSPEAGFIFAKRFRLGMKAEIIYLRDEVQVYGYFRSLSISLRYVTQK
jgi:hypothetical protein